MLRLQMLSPRYMFFFRAFFHGSRGINFGSFHIHERLYQRKAGASMMHAKLRA